jgi:hypothetical protein
MRLINALIAHVRDDYIEAKSVAGYLKRRLLEKGTWISIGAAVIAADKLSPPIAVASVAIAAIVALVPTP